MSMKMTLKALLFVTTVAGFAYAYEQVTGDSGQGAVLGGFEGRVFALGPALDYTFKVGQTPVVTNLRYFYEFGVENRLQGFAGFLNVAIPLFGHSSEEPEQ